MIIPDEQTDLSIVSRARRPLPAREGPLRNAVHAFKSAEHAVHEPPRSVPPAANANAVSGTTQPAQRVVEAAVETAYRVYDEYVRWGQASAAQRTYKRDWRAPMQPKAPDPRAAASEWLRLWQEMYGMWMGYLTPLLSNPSGPFAMPGSAPPSFPFGAAPPFGPSPFAPPAPSAPLPNSNVGPELDFELDAAQRVRVSMQLLRRPSGGKLKATLHREEGEGRLLLDFDAACIRIALSPQQTPGTYAGLVRDEQGDSCGMMTLRVFESTER